MEVMNIEDLPLKTTIVEGDGQRARSDCCKAKLTLDNVRIDFRDEGEDTIVGVEGNPRCAKCKKPCGVETY